MSYKLLDIKNILEWNNLLKKFIKITEMGKLFVFIWNQNLVEFYIHF